MITTTRDKVLEALATLGIYADDDELVEITESCEGLNASQIRDALERLYSLRGHNGDTRGWHA